MRCSNCGLEVEKQESYCLRCGEKLEEKEEGLEQEEKRIEKKPVKSKLEQRTLWVGVVFFLLAIIPFHKVIAVVAMIAGMVITAIGIYLKQKQEGIRPWRIISLGIAILLTSTSMFLFYEYIIMI